MGEQGHTCRLPAPPAPAPMCDAARGSATPLQGPSRDTGVGGTDNTLQSYLCFSACMSLPPALKAKMSFLVLAHLSFSLVRSGESWSPQAARQRESGCEEQAGRQKTNRATEEKGDQVRWGVGCGVWRGLPAGDRLQQRPTPTHSRQRGAGSQLLEGQGEGTGQALLREREECLETRTMSQASPHPRGQRGAGDTGGPR